MLTSGKLTEYLAEVDDQAQELFDTIVNQTKEVWEITEDLKAEDSVEWMRQMNSIVNMAEEFVLQELVYNDLKSQWSIDNNTAGFCYGGSRDVWYRSKNTLNMRSWDDII